MTTPDFYASLKSWAIWITLFLSGWLSCLLMLYVANFLTVYTR